MYGDFFRLESAAWEWRKIETLDIYDGVQPGSTPLHPQATRSTDGRLPTNWHGKRPAGILQASEELARDLESRGLVRRPY